jgi:hypothetical protein
MNRHIGALAQLFVRLGRDDRGGETLEYSLTLGFFALLCYVLMSMVGLKFVDFWYRIDRAFTML